MKLIVKLKIKKVELLFKKIKTAFPKAIAQYEKNYVSFTFGGALYYQLRVQKDKVRMMATNYPNKAKIGECLKLIKKHGIEGQDINGNEIIFEVGARNPEIFTLRIEMPYKSGQLEKDSFNKGVVDSCAQFHNILLPLINNFLKQPVGDLFSLMGGKINSVSAMKPTSIKTAQKKVVSKNIVPKKTIKKSKEKNIKSESIETELDWELELKKVLGELEESNHSSNKSNDKKQSNKNKKQEVYSFIEDEIEEDPIELFQWTCYNLNGVKKFTYNCTFIYAIANNLFAIKKGELYGVINDSGQTIVPYKYDQIDKFSNGLARVQLGGRWTGKFGYIDEQGKEVIKCQFDDADDFSEGFARIKINEKWGFINKEGVQKIKPSYSFAGSFSEGLASVTKKEKIGFINFENKLVIDHFFDSAESFNGGVSIVSDNGKYGLINKKGVLLTKCKYAEMQPFNGKYAIVSNGDNLGYLDRLGKEVISCEYDFANEFIDGTARVIKNGDYFLINEKNIIISKGKYDTISNYFDGLSAVSKDDKYGFIDKQGKIFVKLTYDWVSDFNAGFASVQENNLWGIIDTKGKVVIEPSFDEVEFVPKFPLIIGKRNGQSKIISLNNEFTLNNSYSEIRLLYNNLFICKSDLNVNEDEMPETNDDILTKTELFEVLWDKVGGFLYNYSYTTNVTADEADYIENRGLGCKNLGVQKNRMIKIKISLESYVDTNFNDDFIKYFNTDKLPGNKSFLAKDLESWINKCFRNLCDLYAGFSVMGGEVLYPEYGENPWENEKTIYLELPNKQFTLKELNKKWNKKSYLLDNKKMKSILSELEL